MAELDYAFLAEYTRIDADGGLTALSASFTHVAVGQLPAQHLLSIGGRVRAVPDESTQLSVTVASPSNSYNINMDTTMSRTEERVYQGKVGLVFSVNIMIPLPEVGLYEVLLGLDGQEVRRLAFEVELSPRDLADEDHSH